MAFATTAPKITLWGWLNIFFELIVLVPFQIVRNAPPAIYHAKIQRLPLGSTIINAIIRAIMTRASPKSLHVLLPSSSEVYQKWIVRKGGQRGFIPYVQEGVQGKSRLFWLTQDPNLAQDQDPRRKVLLFFHGGGYVMPLSDGHLDWMAHVHDQLKLRGTPIAVALLEYALVPEDPYPTQLAQAIDGLQTLVDDGILLSDIVIGGDSAGGHLVLSLLAHLHHPRPAHGEVHLLKNTPMLSIPPKSGPLAGVCLISPLVSFETDTRRFPSYETNRNVDLLSAHIVVSYGDYLIGDRSGPWTDDYSKGNGWAMSLDIVDKNDLGVETWWNGLANVVKTIAITTGEFEVFRDPVVEFGTRLGRVFGEKPENDGVFLMVQRKETHDGPFIDFAMGRPASSTTKAIVDFVDKCLH